uniref:Protein ALTERED XYLOGLUCAN 4 n=1 Tax=Rhizophora mucronata TaxID=61149 RepID=A0A2P2IRV3_RHIMU
MGTNSPFKRVLPCAAYAILPLLLFRLYFYPCPLPHSNPILISSSVSPSAIEEKSFNETPCDYTNGRWVHEKRVPLYNGTTCGTIKEGQNCIGHGRPDLGYLYWRWEPKECKISRFEPNKFLDLLRNKHLAFIGDSIARNQLESLLCMLATASASKLVYLDGEDNKFRRWYFYSHNVNVSIYWSPFLVRGVEKSNTGLNHNKLYLDQIDEKWADEMNGFDMILLSLGHWFLHPAVYYEGDNVLGCHYCPGLNYTEIGFYDVLRKALKTTLKTIAERRGNNGSGVDVVLTTFSPSHFEGDWDKFGACSKTKPYVEGEKSLEGMDAEMRQIEIEEVDAAAKVNAKRFRMFRLEALDVTKLSLLRPDAHPGPYMYPFPFANGITERVQNDCVHWCLPGAIDTWNEILLEVMKKWEHQSRRVGGT